MQKMIDVRLSEDTQQATIYILSDLHVGSAQCDIKLFQKWKKEVINTENSYVILNGDLVDNTTKNSKGDVYENTMTPQQQLEWLITELEPLKSKILVMTQGNHERRSQKESGIDINYALATSLGIIDKYRKAGAWLRLSLGSNYKNKPQSYILYINHHGYNLKRLEDFSRSLDNVDITVFSHVHKPNISIINKLVADARNKSITEKECYVVVTGSYLSFGGYGEEKLYIPQCRKTPKIILSGTERKIEVVL